MSEVSNHDDWIKHHVEQCPRPRAKLLKIKIEGKKAILRAGFEISSYHTVGDDAASVRVVCRGCGASWTGMEAIGA